MSTRITYFVHGTTTDNENRISSGWYDSELSETGKNQALKLKNVIDVHSFDAVFCSDLKRAVNSAGLVFGGAVPIIQDQRLRECNYGDYNAKTSEIVEPLQEKHIRERFPGWESYEDVKLRMSEFLDDISEKYEGARIAIVAHKAPQLALDVLLSGKTWGQAFAEDWRKKGEWKPGWEYETNL